MSYSHISKAAPLSCIIPNFMVLKKIMNLFSVQSILLGQARGGSSVRCLWRDALGRTLRRGSAPGLSVHAVASPVLCSLCQSAGNAQVHDAPLTSSVTLSLSSTLGIPQNRKPMCWLLNTLTPMRWPLYTILNNFVPSFKGLLLSSGRQSYREERREVSSIYWLAP